MNKEISAVIMAAGKGLRMGELSKGKPKPMIEIEGIPVLERTIRTLRSITVNDIVVVLNAEDTFTPLNFHLYCRKTVQNTVSQPGTAEAAKQGLKVVPYTPERRVLIINGDDSSLIKPETFQLFIHQHFQTGVDCTVMVTPINIDTLKLCYLGEEDITPTGGIKYKYCGVLIARYRWLEFFLPQIIPEGDNLETKITRIFELGRQSSLINQFILKNSQEWNDFNTPEEMEITNKKMIRNF